MPVSYTHLDVYKRQEYACFVNCENFQAMFRALDDEYMQARAADIGDISCLLYTSMQSHERCSVVEVMGRRAGHLALQVGCAVGATAICLPDVYKRQVSTLLWITPFPWIVWRRLPTCDRCEKGNGRGFFLP